MSALRLTLVALLIIGPAVGQEPNLPDGVRLRLGSDRFREANYVSAAALSPDGKRVAVCSGGQTICMLDATTGAELSRFTLREYMQTPQLLFTPDGKQFVTGGYNGVNLWDAATGRLVSTVTNPKRDGRDGQLHLSADGKTVAVGCQYNAGPVKILDLQANQQISTVQPPHSQNTLGAMSPDGSLVAAWGQHYGRGTPDEAAIPRTVLVYDAKTGTEKTKMVTDIPTVTTVRFSPDGAKVAAAGWGRVQLWDVATGKLDRQFAGRTGQGKHVVFSPDGKTLSTAGDDGSVQSWDVATGKRAGICEGVMPNVVALQYRPDNQLVALGIRSNAVEMWEVPSGKRLTPAGGHSAAVSSLLFGPDNKTLLSSATDGRVLRWDTATGKELGPFELAGPDGAKRLPQQQSGPIVFSPDGKYLLAGGWSNNGTAVWDAVSGTELFAITGPTGYLDRNGLIAMSADSGRLATVTRYGGREQAIPITLWDLDSGLPLPTLKGQIGDFSAAALSTDGTILATAAYTYPPRGGQVTEVWAWDIASGKVLSKVTYPNMQINGLVFLDERTFVPVVPNSQVQKVYDAPSGQEVRTLEGFLNPNPRAMVLSPDRRLLAIPAQGSVNRAPSPDGMPDRTGAVRIYEIATGSVRHELTGVAGQVTALGFSRDGKTLAIGSSDTTILLWDVVGPPEKSGPLSRTELTELWGALDVPGARAAETAIRKLAARPAEAVPYLAEHVKPAPAAAITQEGLTKLVADLDAPRYAVRERASRELERHGAPARATVTETLARSGVPPEMRERLEKIRTKLDLPESTDGWVRSLRAVEVLERIGTPEAMAHLKALAVGGDSPVTNAARGAVGRLGR